MNYREALPEQFVRSVKTLKVVIKKHLKSQHAIIKYQCNTFTPQVKEIPEDTFAMYISLQGDI